MYLGSIEAGGTKFVCAVANEKIEILERVSFPTTDPEETINLVFEFFDRYELSALACCSFGPVDVNHGSPTYGHILNTPKLPWQGFDLVGVLKSRYNVPIALTTDVNGAAIGELNFGAAKGLDSCLYLTVGTGIGGGAVVAGHILEGYGHPEMGHLLVRPHSEDKFKGHCPIHGNCLEGMAAGPAIEARWGMKASLLESNHPAWNFEAFYIAQGLMSYVLTLSPKRIILGGGVMKQAHLFPKIRENLETLLNGYVSLPSLDTYIVPPALGDDAGILGGLYLAKKVILG